MQEDQPLHLSSSEALSLTLLHSPFPEKQILKAAECLNNGWTIPPKSNSNGCLVLIEKKISEVQTIFSKKALHNKKNNHTHPNPYQNKIKVTAQ